MAVLMSVRAYAKARGVAHTTVDYHVRTGKLKLIDGKVDPEYADVVLREKIDRKQSDRGAGQRRKNGGTDAAAGQQEGGFRFSEQDLSNIESIRQLVPRSYSEVQFLTQVEDLLKRRLANDEAEGRLGDVDAMSQAQFDLARQIRDAMLAIPARIQDMLAAESDPIACGRILEAEIRSSLEAEAEHAGAVEEGSTAIDAPAAGAGGAQ